MIDRNDPIAEIVAKTVIEIGATGVREPSEISKMAVKRLARLGRPRLTLRLRGAKGPKPRVSSFERQPALPSDPKQ